MADNDAWPFAAAARTVDRGPTFESAYYTGGGSCIFVVIIVVIIIVVVIVIGSDWRPRGVRVQMRPAAI